MVLADTELIQRQFLCCQIYAKDAHYCRLTTEFLKVKRHKCPCLCPGLLQKLMKLFLRR